MANKIELMHRIFGKNEKYCCIECSHFKRKTYGSRTYRKCEVYGDSNSTGTDWKASYIACGLEQKLSAVMEEFHKRIGMKSCWFRIVNMEEFVLR